MINDSWREIGAKQTLSQKGLSESLLGGQSFSWSQIAKNQWVGIVQRSIVGLRWEFDRLKWRASGPAPLTEEEICHYLWLDDSYEQAVDELPWRSDQVLHRAIEKFSGLRILRQPLDEMLLVFILSSAKSIPQIKEARRRIYELLGEDLGDGMRAFPGWDRLRDLSEADARKLGIGYRAKFLVGVAEFLGRRRGWLEEIRGLEMEEARTRLMELPGVGPKVADCVLLFGGQKPEAFPVDTWILQAIEKQYGLKNWNLGKIQDFARIHFGRHAGLAQQFLFSLQRAESHHAEFVDD